ncbi:hypothetical protein EJ08DRAFT_169679 [Tothia fuscella]|uniref:Uncharacterized protein n=1 Tax=Tothia fuscella TaxID=1048955 RepID=A0A9P4TZS0_9PEZI|nr:hypothetical protein EJ08DRAFT_169679 [Tothia fuscella]
MAPDLLVASNAPSPISSSGPVIGKIQLTYEKMVSGKGNHEPLPKEIWLATFRLADLNSLVVLIKSKPEQPLKSLLTQDLKLRREAHFGAGMAACPNIMSEVDYIDLVIGENCMYCRSIEGSTTTFWRFRQRLCATCQGKYVMNTSQALAVLLSSYSGESDLLEHVPSFYKALRIHDQGDAMSHASFRSLCQTCGQIRYIYTEPRRYNDDPFFQDKIWYVEYESVPHAGHAARELHNRAESGNTLCVERVDPLFFRPYVTIAGRMAAVGYQ